MSSDFEKCLAKRVESQSLEVLRNILVNKSGDVKLTNRFRALFNLKSIAEKFSTCPEEAKTAVEYICECFEDESELLKHEVAYVLGQTMNTAAVPKLCEVMLNQTQQCMVRHEASEALGALADESALVALEKSLKEDTSLEVRQTSELAIQRIKWILSTGEKKENLQTSLYSSIDPAPPFPLDKQYKIQELQDILNSQDTPLFTRYRAMFRLRDIGSDEACFALASGFKDPSALFKHEIAYVFGQIGNPCVVPNLVEVLKRKNEAPMVRHEAAEALGSIATDDVFSILKEYTTDEVNVVRESALIALDMYEYENSNELEYAS